LMQCRAGALRAVRLDSRQPSTSEVPMRRIGLAVVLALGLALAPLTTDAQQAGKVPGVGVLWGYSPSDVSRFGEAFRQGLANLGYVGGGTIVIHERWWESVACSALCFGFGGGGGTSSSRGVGRRENPIVFLRSRPSWSDSTSTLSLPRPRQQLELAQRQTRRTRVR